MRRRCGGCRWPAAAAPLLLGGAAKPRLVPDVSQRRIDIIYSFTGAELLLFGAIVYPGGRVPAPAGDVVVVIKGPAKSVLLREKQKIAGIWLNAESARFRSVPSFYAVASSRPLGRRGRSSGRRRSTSSASTISSSRRRSGALPEVQQRFEHGLVDLKRRAACMSRRRHGVEVSERRAVPRAHRLPARCRWASPPRPFWQDGRVIGA